MGGPVGPSHRRREAPATNWMGRGDELRGSRGGRASPTPGSLALVDDPQNSRARRVSAGSGSRADPAGSLFAIAVPTADTTRRAWLTAGVSWPCPAVSPRRDVSATV